ncbi:50S ribosomal protein L23, partial [Candidatus Daviesbacteria bacterium]|nr:50S ribosomal protein L23 [Candidatus Daviesbacteria bacterium]
TFEVVKGATKDQIAKDVADKFKVTVVSVKTLNQTGKTKMQRTKKGHFKESDLRKALVKVSKNDKITIFEHSQPEEEVTVTTAEGEPVSQVKEKKSLLRGTKVKIEKTAESVENDKRKLARMEDHTSSTKVSDKPEKKGKA